MAQTSSAFSGIPSAQYTRLYLDFWVASQSTANNQTTFGYKLVIGGVDGGAGSTQGGAYTFSNAWSASASGLTWSWSTSSHKTIREGTFVVTHNADGTLSNRTLTAAASFVTSGGTATASTSVTISVPTIPRYAAITAFDVAINDRTATLSWTADKTISQWRWSTNSGSTYSGWTTVNASSGSTSVSVSPGSTYGFRIQVINSASGLITTSSVVSKTATKTPSTLTLSTTSQNVGSGITWTVNESYDYTHKISYVFGSASNWILGDSSTQSSTLTGTWTLPTALANQIPNATSGSGTIYLITYYGGEGGVRVGEKAYTFTAKVPNNSTWQPTVPTVTITHVGSRPAGATSYVQGKSKAKVVSSSTAQGGAYVSNHRVTVSGIGTYYGTDITSGYLINSGTVTITVRATDSRGYYREKVSTVPVAAYSPPKLTAYSARRSPNDQGTNLGASINFSISPIDNQNAKQYRIRYRPTGGTWVTLVNSGDYYTRSTGHTATDVLDVNKSYEVEFYVADYYTSVTQTRNIGTAFQLLDFNASGRGVAFGKVSESDSFEVGIPAEFTNSDFRMPNGRRVAYLAQSNANDVVEEWVLGSDGSNYPNTGFWYLHTIIYETLAQRKQIAYGYTNNDVYTRHVYQGTWSAWVKTNGVSSVAWADVSGKPAQATRWPTWSEVTSKPSTATRWPAWSEVTSKPDVVDSSGSNANGRYVKFTDGTMICSASRIINETVSAHSVFTRTWVYPAKFYGLPAKSIIGGYGASSLTTKVSINTSGSVDSDASCVIIMENPYNGDAVMRADAIAIGRWK